eukprot:366460-Chlamydomonas_euryale.AAC.11
MADASIPKPVVNSVSCCCSSATCVEADMRRKRLNRRRCCLAQGFGDVSAYGGWQQAPSSNALSFCSVPYNATRLALCAPGAVIQFLPCLVGRALFLTCAAATALAMDVSTTQRTTSCASGAACRSKLPLTHPTAAADCWSLLRVSDAGAAPSSRSPLPLSDAGAAPSSRSPLPLSEAERDADTRLAACRTSWRA